MIDYRFVATDEQGNFYLIDSKFPRKWLLDHFGRKHTDKIYVQDTLETAKHIGYIIAGHWLIIRRLSNWKKESV